ncbi:hypothetical protein LTR17_005978 [Elasticomyces elasticus]|nr:hypothetical protein LTR17_005978 [Elasticomyces elasticus]
MTFNEEDLETRLFINNEFVDSQHANRLTLRNPVDDSIVTESVHLAGEKDVDYAVEVATEAFRTGPWSKFTGAQRAKCMLKFADLAEANAVRLAEIESIATGRPKALIQYFDVAHMVEVFRCELEVPLKDYAGWADKIEGESFIDEDGLYRIVQYEPLGVCAGIASWNATLLYVAWKMAPALATGNTFVFKTSEKAPLGALALAPLFAEAGFPAGVVNILSGAAETGSLLASHMNIAKISFTGSAFVGRLVQVAATKSNLKRVTLELGGKSPAIVFPDAPMDIALQSVGAGFLVNSGQICIAGSRVFVHADIADKFIAGLKDIFEKASQVLGANPIEMTTSLGPVVDKKQFDRIMGMIEDGKKSAKVVTGGSRKGDKGCFIEPTIFSEPANDSAILREEIFGPVLVVKTFKTEQEVVGLANDTTYGLSARALRVARKLEAGAVGINTPHMPNKNTPFGGKKQSGNGGRELGLSSSDMVLSPSSLHALTQHPSVSGKHGLQSYLEAKTIHINMNLPSRL